LLLVGEVPAGLFGFFQKVTHGARWPGRIQNKDFHTADLLALVSQSVNVCLFRDVTGTYFDNDPVGTLQLFLA